MRRLMFSFFVTVSVLAFALTGPAAFAELSFTSGTGRTVYWRGEQVMLSASGPLAEAAQAAVEIQSEGGAPIQVWEGTITPADGVAHLNLLLPTTALLGSYTATLEAGGERASVVFTVRDIVPRSQGMIIDDNVGAVPAPNSRLAGQTAHIEYMSSDATHEIYRTSTQQLNRRFDAFADQQMLYWIQDSTRPMSFSPPHSHPETDGEYLRRMLLMSQVLMRYPSYAGMIFDYDPTGYLNKAAHLTSYWRWGGLHEQVAEYMQKQEDALRENFRRKTGLDPLTDAEVLLFGAAVGSPEGMGYFDMPTRTWAQQIAARSDAIDPDQLADLTTRAHAWFGYLMHLSRDRYANYMGNFNEIANNTLSFSTALTLGHMNTREGGDLGVSYEPLQFRFLSVWDDQGGAPEHIYETILAATLLNANRRQNQPLWVNTVFGRMPGNHFRNSLNLAGRGAQGTGYSFEMGSSLSYQDRGRRMLASNDILNQEVALNKALMERFGGIFENSRHTAPVGILYSQRQAVITPYSQSYVDNTVKMMYLLSHVGLPPRLVTEQMIDDPKRYAPEWHSETKVLIVLNQTEELRPETVARLREFVANGGRIITCTQTTVGWDFAEQDAVFNLPFRDLGHPYNMNTAFNRQDATVGAMRELVEDRCPRMQELLAEAIAQQPLTASSHDVATATLEGGDARFVIVTNDAMLDFSQMFTDEQKLSAAYQKMFVGHGEGAMGSWMPLDVELIIGADYRDWIVYDLFKMQRVTPDANGRFVCDLQATPGRIYAMYPQQMDRLNPSISAENNAGEDIRVFIASPSTVVPVEISLLNPDGHTVWSGTRATDASGELAIKIPTERSYRGLWRVELRELLEGNRWSMPMDFGNQQVSVKAQPVAGASARDPESIRRFFADEPELVVPVLDDAMLAPAQRLVAGLREQGLNARVWQNSPVVDYTLAYTLNEEQQIANTLVNEGDAFGRVQFRNMVHHVNGNFYGSAMTGWRYGKHVVLLGTEVTNPVLEGVAKSGILWHDASTRAPGGALVQRVMRGLCRDHDTIVIHGADAAGIEAGIAMLLNLPQNDPVSEHIANLRSEAFSRRSLRHLRDIDWDATGMTNEGAQRLEPSTEGKPNFSMLAVTGVDELEDGALMVRLGRWANNLVIIGADGSTSVLPTVNTRNAAAAGRDVIVTATGSKVIAYRRDGSIAWRAMGSLKGVLPNSNDAVVEANGANYRIAANGTWTAYEGEMPRMTGGYSARTQFFDQPQIVKAGDTELFETVYVTDRKTSADDTLTAVASYDGTVVVHDAARRIITRANAGAYPRIFPLKDGGFAVGSTDGKLTLIGAGGDIRSIDMIEAGRGLAPDDIYAAIRNTPLLTWSNPPKVPGEVPFSALYWYLRDAHGRPQMVNWSPGRAVDFRWKDLAQGEIAFPQTRRYTVTIKAAAKYFDDVPMAQPSWIPMLTMRKEVIKNERFEPYFRLLVNGREAATLKPEGNALKPFHTVWAYEGWATLDPKPEEVTTFTAELIVEEGAHLIGIESVNMEDCFVRSIEIR